MHVEGAHVLITGASRGLGAALARAFANAGARLTLVARDGQGLSEVASRAGAAIQVLDLTSIEALPSLVDRITEDRGPIDILVNNAARIDGKGFLALSTADIESLIRLDLITPLLLTRLVLPHMIQQKRGRVVMISSIGSVLGAPGLSTYCASKAGLARFTTALEMELEGMGVGFTQAQFSNVAGGGTLDECLSSGAYPPTRDFMRLAYRLHLTADTPCATAAQAVVDAVRRDQRTVRLPARHVPFYVLAGAPAWISARLFRMFPGSQDTTRQ